VYKSVVIHLGNPVLTSNTRIILYFINISLKLKSLIIFLRYILIRFWGVMPPESYVIKKKKKKKDLGGDWPQNLKNMKLEKWVKNLKRFWEVMGPKNLLMCGRVVKNGK
jgi:hypothetical protein